MIMVKSDQKHCGSCRFFSGNAKPVDWKRKQIAFEDKYAKCFYKKSYFYNAEVLAKSLGSWCWQPRFINICNNA